MGICLGASESHCLTNPRFDDDVLLFSTSLESVGLRIHLEKTEIPSNQSSNKKSKSRYNQLKYVPCILDKQQRSSNMGDHPNAELSFWHMDTIKRTREIDTIDSAQNASLHCPNETKVQDEDSGQQ